MGIPDDALTLLRSSNRDHDKLVRVHFDRCEFCCCGRSFEPRKDIAYVGYVNELHDRTEDGTFTLLGLGVGTVGYVVTAKLDDVRSVVAAS